MPTSTVTPSFAAFLIETLRLESHTAADLTAELPLFAGGLNLDSIDVIDLRIAMRTRYGVELPLEGDAALSHAATIGTLLALVADAAVT